MKKLITEAKIIDGKMVYMDKNFEKDFQEFKAKNNEHWIEIEYKVVDSVEYYLHKYYRGALLPIISQSKDRYDLYKTHTLLKKQHLFVAINDDWKEIPDRFLEKGTAVVEEADLFDVVVPLGRTILIVRANKMVGYIPSTAHLTSDEMKGYIQRCDLIVDGLDTLDVAKEILSFRKYVYEYQQGQLFP